MDKIVTRKLYFAAISIRRCGGKNQDRLGISIVFKSDLDGGDRYYMIISPSFPHKSGERFDSKLRHLHTSNLTTVLSRLIDCTSNQVLESLKDCKNEINCTFVNDKLTSFTIGTEYFREDNE